MDLDLFKLVIALRGSADNLKQVLKQTYRGGLADDRYSKTFTEDYLKLFRELVGLPYILIFIGLKVSSLPFETVLVSHEFVAS